MIESSNFNHIDKNLNFKNEIEKLNREQNSSNSILDKDYNLKKKKQRSKLSNKNLEEELDNLKNLLEEERVSHRIMIEKINKDHQEEIGRLRGEIDNLKSNLIFYINSVTKIPDLEKELNKINIDKQRITRLLISAEEIFNSEKHVNIYTPNSKYFYELKSESDANIRKIKTDQIKSDENFYSNFTCIVCAEFYDDYECCQKCCKMCCNNCIKKSYDKCPYCRQEPFITRKLSLLEKKLMNILEVECPYKCGKILKYDRYYGHFDECVNIIKTFKCSNCDSLLNTKGSDKSNLNDHLKFCKIRCTHCDLKYPLIDFDKHVKECIERIMLNFEKFVSWSKDNARNDIIERLKTLIRQIIDSN